MGYGRLLEVFWSIHDPTRWDGQGLDIGSQYRSAIFYHDEDQRREAEASRDEVQASGQYRQPIATEITPASTFWRAEEYHQRYLQKTGGPGCHI